MCQESNELSKIEIEQMNLHTKILKLQIIEKQIEILRLIDKSEIECSSDNRVLIRKLAEDVFDDTI